MSKQPSSALKCALRRQTSAPASPINQPTSSSGPHRTPPILVPAAAVSVILAAGALAGIHHWQGLKRSTPTATVAAMAQAMPMRPGYLICTGNGLEVPPTATAFLTTAFLRPSPQAWRSVSARGDRPSDTLTMAAAPTLTEEPSEDTPTPAPTEEPRGIITYQVAAGDTLAGLAQRFGISTQTIIWANDLQAGEVLQVGQELTIPPVSGVLYRVQRGDSLYIIATLHGVSINDIAAANHLDPAEYLVVDQLLVIPGAEPLPAPSKPTTAPPPTESPSPTAPSEPTAVAPEAANKGQQIANIAAGFVGYPYTWGGSSPATGFDCSGFSWYVCSQAGIAIPNHDLPGQIAAGQQVAINELLPGDLVFFVNTYKAGLSHVGVYVGGGSFIHAASAGAGVRYDRIDDAYYSAHYYCASRPW